MAFVGGRGLAKKRLRQNGNLNTSAYNGFEREEIDDREKNIILDK